MHRWQDELSMLVMSDCVTQAVRALCVCALQRYCQVQRGACGAHAAVKASRAAPASGQRAALDRGPVVEMLAREALEAGVCLCVLVDV